MRHRLVSVAAVVAVIVSVPGPALAAWSGDGQGRGYARAQALPVGPSPAISVSGRNVTLTWGAVSFPSGAAVGGYRVWRFPAAGGAAETVSSSCDGTVVGLTCTESAVPPGSWTYRVAAVKAGWTGPQGSASATATVGSPTFTFSSSAPVTTLPATLAGSLSDYITGQTVTFRLNAPTGTLLAGSTSPSPIPALGAATTSVTIPAGTTDGVHTVYAIGSAGDVATATVTTDGSAPVVSAAAIGKSQGGVVGTIKQGGTYYVYASIADVGSGVTSARADVSAITAGSTAVTLTAGTYTAGGVSYDYRSALLTASNPLAAGSKAFSITATDGAAHTGTATGFTVTVDNTGPSGADVQTTNKAGGVAGRAETGDSVTFTFSEPIDPGSLVAGWDGTGSQTVTVRLLQNGTGDKLQVWDPTNMARLALGTVQLSNTDYVGPGFNFTSSTMTMSGSTITVVFGTPSGTGNTVTVPGTMIWTPSNGATDWAANACSTTNASESGGADVEF